jgi:hypothetical protein
MSKPVVKAVVKKPVNRSENTILSNPLTYDIKNIIFDVADACTIPNTNINYYRINIGTKNADGKEGELVIGFDRCNSSGLSEVRDQSSGKLTGYSLAINMTNRDGSMSDKQKASLDLIEKILEKAKQHLLKEEVKEQVQRNIKEHDLNWHMSPVWYKRDQKTEEIVEGAQPMIFCKLLYSKDKVDKQGKAIPAKIVSDFWLEGSGEEVNPLDFLGKKSSVRCAVKVESIFVNKKELKLQLKLMQTYIKPIETGRRRLLEMEEETNINLDGTSQYLNNDEIDIDIENNKNDNNYDIYEEKIELSDHEEEKPKEIKKRGKKN